jgi:hypothetical protein
MRFGWSSLSRFIDVTAQEAVSISIRLCGGSQKKNRQGLFSRFENDPFSLFFGRDRQKAGSQEEVNEKGDELGHYTHKMRTSVSGLRKSGLRCLRKAGQLKVCNVASSSSDSIDCIGRSHATLRTRLGLGLVPPHSV